MNIDLRPITQEQRDRMSNIFKESGRTFQDLLTSAVSGARDSLRFAKHDHMEELTRGELERIIFTYRRKTGGA